MAIFTESERKTLESNPNVKKVTKSQVTYTLKFKLLALKKYHEGIPPKRIFSDAEINLNVFPDSYAKNTIRRWLKIGSDKIQFETRGSKKGRFKKKVVSQKQEIAQLKAEIWILKKLQALAKKSKK